MLKEHMLITAGQNTSAEVSQTNPMQPVVIPIDGTLDLHTFAPGDIKALLKDYIDACLESNIHMLRIIHGKGTGTLRIRVRALLERDPRVQSICDAPADAGGWGATLVTLKKDGIWH